MATRVFLDFITPFSIGDLVFARHPPKEIPNTGGPAWPPYRQGTIAQVKLVLEESVEKALVITQATDKKLLQVACVLYTLVGQSSDHHQSAFTVECSTNPDSELMLFGSEEEINAYLQQIPK